MSLNRQLQPFLYCGRVVDGATQVPKLSHRKQRELALRWVDGQWKSYTL